MGKRSIKNSLFMSILLIYILIYMFFLLDKLLIYSESITASFCLLVAFISFILFGYQKDKKKYLKKNILGLVITQIIMYFVIIYSLGFLVGFLKNSYSLSVKNIFSNIFFNLIMIVGIEITRYNIINANKDSKFIIAGYTLIFMLMELMLFIGTYDLSNTFGIFRFVTLAFIPLLVKHFLLSYLTYMVGYKPALLYRIVMECYVFLVPLEPDLGDYLSSIFSIGLPFLIFVYSSRMIGEYENGIEHDFSKGMFHLIDIPFYVFFILLICLISGYFSYFILGIGSQSMEPVLKRGDAVIVHKVNSPADLQEGDIIVYEHDGLSIVHRIVIKTEKDGEFYFYTKGDGNNSSDDIELSMKDIRGKVLLKIPYVAKPSIYVSNLIG